MTSGIARPRACGQAITSTVTVRSTASSGSPSSDPDDERDQGGADGDVEQQRRGPIGEDLRPGARRLGLGDEPLDAGQRGVVADGLRPGCAGRNRSPPSRPRRSRPAAFGTGRDSPVSIDSSTSDAPSTTMPSAGTRPPERTSTRSPAAERCDRNGLDLPSPATQLGLVGQQLGQLRERALRLTDGLHLHPVTEQHDHDEAWRAPTRSQSRCRTRRRTTCRRPR